MTRHSIHDLTNATAYDRNGDKLGSVKEVYINDTTGQPDFAEVGHGLFGLQSSIVPLRGHTLEGGDLKLAFTKDLIKDAPSIKHDEHLSEEDHATIYRHFGLEKTVDVHTYGQEGADLSGDRFDRDPLRGDAPRLDDVPHSGVGADRERAVSDHELGLDQTPEDRAMRGTSAHGMSDEPREYNRDIRDTDPRQEVRDPDRLAADEFRDQRANPGPQGPVDADGRPLAEGDENYPRSNF
ncbi:PRC-barrel domain-containing protein [Corynebacterium comes]|uniref:PRC-barrel domain protein n=1 Tax=Corynebacterium comes TaxID=2675218 RepID=A0A6B8W0T4_9CORY|nr:PRC-barrel domain-containing protein [Corynebacterium comes]QGU05617.1 PRC-barrel domain protein [Corynebacterium comes]